jgi:hypothetical protein
MATTKNCRACGSPIPQSAKLCHVCKTYQHRFRASIHFLSSSTPLWVAAASLLFWAITQLLPTVRILLWPREDVQVVTANPLQGATIVNFGDHEVFVSHIVLFMTGRTSNWIAQHFPVDDSLAPGKLLRVAAPRTGDFDSGFFVRGVEAAKWEKFVDQAYSDKQCFQILLFAVNDPFFQEMAESAGPSLNQVPTSGYVEYRTISATLRRTYTLKQPVQATGVIRARSTPDCEKKVTDVGGH